MARIERLCHGCISAGLLLCLPYLGGCTAQKYPIEAGVVERTTTDGPLRGCWAKVHLDADSVRVHVTGQLPPGASLPRGAEACLRTVPEWAEATHETLAVNANFFSKVIPPKAGEPDPGWLDNMPVDLVGLSVSEGRVISPPRVVAGQGDPALLITKDHRARIEEITSLPSDVDCAVAGMGRSDKGHQPGSLLVTDGRNTGETARVQPAARHPRTAAGVTADGRTLILLVIDGRQPAHSVGATLPELADIMISLGAANAINLDGGGSSSFYFHRPDGTLMINHPSGGHWRPVGNHLGIAVGKN